MTTIYNQCRHTPNIERDHPPTIGTRTFRTSSTLSLLISNSGRILWARRMYKRLQHSYKKFTQRTELKGQATMAKTTNDFLTAANGFALYELLHHRHWWRFVPRLYFSPTYVYSGTLLYPTPFRRCATRCSFGTASLGSSTSTTTHSLIPCCANANY